MRMIIGLFTVACVLGSVFWAYHENYKTQEAFSKSEQLQRDIGTARARLAVLHAEWAYLNRPDRLRELAELNFDRIGLLPLTPEHFGMVNEVGYPVPEDKLEFDIDGSVEVSSDGADQ